MYYCPSFPLRERPGEKNIFRNNEVCALIPRGFKVLTGFLFSHSHNGTFCNDLTPQHGTTTELENIYLSGDFGVWLGPDGYTIGKRLENVTGLLNQCGYPFYSGKFATEFTVPENCCQIRLQAKAHSASLYIDGELADVAYVKPFCFPILSSDRGRQAKIVLSGSVENTSI